MIIIIIIIGNKTNNYATHTDIGTYCIIAGTYFNVNSNLQTYLQFTKQ